MAEHIHTICRETLGELTEQWSDKGTNPAEAYVEFSRTLGKQAVSYDTYLSTAITAGGYRRDTALSYGEVVTRNTEYALSMADELHRQGQIDVHASLDAVALGKVQGWQQSDYLTFFFNAMARPAESRVMSANQRGWLDTVDLTVLDDESLTNEERYPQYLALVEAYWNHITDVDISPIQRIVRVSDWDRTLGGRAEERLAIMMGVRIVTPLLIASTDDLSHAGLPTELTSQMQELRSLGAEILAPPQPTRLVLVDGARWQLLSSSMNSRQLLSPKL